RDWSSDVCSSDLRPVVDFPQPDSPTKPNVSPLWISKETPSTAVTTSFRPTGKCFFRFFTSNNFSCVIFSYHPLNPYWKNLAYGALQLLVAQYVVHLHVIAMSQHNVYLIL